jgi:hypothetical protein
LAGVAIAGKSRRAPSRRFACAAGGDLLLERSKGGAMPRKAAIHTMPAGSGGGWQNRQEGGATRGGFRTQAEAIKAGRDEARRLQTEHIVHRRDGKIRARNSYGNDPRRRPG